MPPDCPERRTWVLMGCLCMGTDSQKPSSSQDEGFYIDSIYQVF